MLALHSSIGGLVVPGDELDGDAEHPLEVSPQVGYKSITIVTNNLLTSSIATQPAPYEGVTAVQGGGLGKGNAF